MCFVFANYNISFILEWEDGYLLAVSQKRKYFRKTAMVLRRIHFVCAKHQKKIKLLKTLETTTRLT